jgi:hypothetical protein
VHGPRQLRPRLRHRRQLPFADGARLPGARHRQARRSPQPKPKETTT